jgi:soluble lytic murein transglycosylase
MRQAIIAIVVCTAGAASGYGLLYGHPAALTEDADAKTTTLKLHAGKSARLERPMPEAQQTADIETASIDSRDTAKVDRGAVTADIGAFPPAATTPSAAFLSGLQALSIRDSATAIGFRDSLGQGSIERMTLTWAIAASGQTAVPARELLVDRSVLKAWPSADDIEDNLEEALYRENAPADTVLAAFADRLPRTPEGAIILARAAIAKSDTGRATRLLKTFWHDKTFDPVLEDQVLGEFAALLDINDHKQRMDHLLFAGKLAQAKRFATMVKADKLYQAFAGVTQKARNAKALLDAVEKPWTSDPAFLFASVKRYRLTKQYGEAARLLGTMPRDRVALVDPHSWWVEARIVSRGLMAAGDAKGAYALAISHLAETPDDIAEAEFHAGWYALRGLKDSGAAETHFNNLISASPKAHDQARGYYWLGRAAEAGGPGKAKEFYIKAADFPATFYGQLAAAKLGIRVELGRYEATPALRATFAQRPEMQAIGLLEQAGEASRARRLYLAFARMLDSPTELQALAESALANHGPSLALAVGKAALRQGHDAGLAAFPLGAIPDTADISGAGKALAYAIARQESGFNPAAVSPANAKGLLQLMPATARKVASRYQMAYAEDRLIDDPAFNATLGSHYLGEQISKFNGSYILTFAAYNAGPNRIGEWIKRYGDPRGKPVDKVVDWIETIPFTETRDYVQRVMENYQVYKNLLNEPADIAMDLTTGGR